MQTWGRYHGGRRPSSDDSLHSPVVIPSSALDKPSIMKPYHRRRTTRWGVTARSPTMVTLHDTRFDECRWWNDGWTVKTVVTWRSSASMIPAPGAVREIQRGLISLHLLWRVLALFPPLTARSSQLWHCLPNFLAAERSGNRLSVSQGRCSYCFAMYRLIFLIFLWHVLLDIALWHILIDKWPPFFLLV